MQLEFEAIGTNWWIQAEDEFSVQQQETLSTLIQNRIAAFDLAYSRFRSDSLVAQMARSAGRYRLPEDAAPMMQLYTDMHALSGGLVTPLIGGLMADAGYDASLSFQAKELQSVPDWAAVVSYQEPELITTEPVRLDFGAAGKGYLVDLVDIVMSEYGARRYVINASGDMLHRGASSLRVGLEDPHDTSQAVGVVELANQSLCASSINRRAWGKYHHLMNPRTQKPVSEVVATWAMASSTMLADMLTTALFFMSPDALKSRYDFEYMIIRGNDDLEASSAFEKSLFTG